MVTNVDGSVIPILKKLTCSELRKVAVCLGEKSAQNKKNILLKLDKVDRIRLIEAVRFAIINMAEKEN